MLGLKLNHVRKRGYSALAMELCHFALTHLPLVLHIYRWTGSSLVQVRVCCLFGAKPLPEPMLAICQLDSRNIFLLNLNWSSIIFIQENSFENVVCQNGGILSGGRWIKPLIWYGLNIKMLIEYWMSTSIFLFIFLWYHFSKLSGN